MKQPPDGSSPMNVPPALGSGVDRSGRPIRTLLVALVVIAPFYLWRLTLGVDLTDESYNIAILTNRIATGPSAP
jgi:hypothetical protein